MITEVLNKTIDANHLNGNFRKAAKTLKDERGCNCSDTTIKNMIKNGEIKFKDGRYIVIL